MPKWTAAALDLVPLLGAWSSGEGPLYSRLASAIEGAIETGDVAAGTRLPPERALAEALELSRTTVVLAYGRLRELLLRFFPDEGAGNDFTLQGWPWAAGTGSGSMSISRSRPSRRRCGPFPKRFPRSMISGCRTS